MKKKLKKIIGITCAAILIGAVITIMILIPESRLGFIIVFTLLVLIIGATYGLDN